MCDETYKQDKLQNLCSLFTWIDNHILCNELIRTYKNLLNNKENWEILDRIPYSFFIYKMCEKWNVPHNYNFSELYKEACLSQWNKLIMNLNTK